MELTGSMIEWLANGQRGVSSETIFTHLTGIKAGSFRDHPYDTSDFMRCEKLLIQCPELRKELPRMADLGSVWAGLIADWDTIVALVNEENPEWMTKSSSTPKAYRRIRSIIEKVRRDEAERLTA